MGSSGILTSGPFNQIPVTGTLEDWEKSTRAGQDRKTETATFFTMSGEPITGFGGDEHSVHVDPRYLQVDGGILTHNHPDNDFGGTLSMQDVKVFAKSNLSEIRAYSEQGYSYSLKAGKNADKDALLRWVKVNQKQMQKNFIRSYESAYKQATTPLKSGPHAGQVKLVNRRTGKVVYRQPMTDAQAVRYARQYSVGAFDRMYQKNLSKFGFTYTSTKAKNIY